MKKTTLTNVAGTTTKIASLTDEDLLACIYNSRHTAMASGGHHKASWNREFCGAYQVEAKKRSLTFDANAEGIFNGLGAY